MDEQRMRELQGHAAALLTERTKYKLLFGLFALISFYTVPIAVLGVVLPLIARFTGSGPVGPTSVGEVLKFAVFVAFAGASLAGAIVFRKKERDAKEQDIFDAQRREALLKKTGGANDKARRVAGVVDAMGGTAPLPRDVVPPPATSAMTVERAAARVRCTWCGRHVSVAHADEESGRATCPSCGHVFSMRDEMKKHMGMRPKPMGLDASVVAHTCTIVHETGTFLSWTAPIVLFVLVLLTVPEMLQNPRPEQRVVVPALVVALVALIVLTAKMKARQTVYTITPEVLIVAIHGLFGRELAHHEKGDVDQVFVRHRTRTRRVKERVGSGDTYRKRTVRTTTYDVVLLDVAGRETVLSRDLASAEHALYIEQEIENRFGIVDRKMGDGPSR